MLGFIMSKMQMLLFATGILIVALMMYGFVSDIELKNVSAGVLETSATIIEAQMTIDSSSSYKKTAIPEILRYGLNGSSRLFYDLHFSTGKEGSASFLILSIAEHKRENIIDSKKLFLDAKIVLVDPGFIAENEPLNSYYRDGENERIVLYPRSSSSGLLAAPNAFVALKEVDSLGETTMYIIPCSSRKNEIPNNCIANVLRTGCYLLGQTSPADNVHIRKAFDITRDVLDISERKDPLTWRNCKDLYGLS
jgi:hypothetical protein